MLNFKILFYKSLYWGIFANFLLNDPLYSASISKDSLNAQIKYMQRFNAYTQWSDNLPLLPESNFLTFIQENTPLAIKLREKWLYAVAKQKNWGVYHTYYQASSDLNLQCFSALAQYYQGNTALALEKIKSLWLRGNALPQTCDPLFTFLKNEPDYESLITQRIILALEQGNVGLAEYLLKKYTISHVQEHLALRAVAANPKSILQLPITPLQEDFYLYGLKRLVSINMQLALKYWSSANQRQLLSPAKQQIFIAHMALFKAIRNHPDAADWFAKINKAFNNDKLTEWQIRLALQQRQWALVKTLIQQAPNRSLPCWQYWLARALEKTGQKDQAKLIYKQLAVERHYYGFLASIRLHKPMAFQNEAPKHTLLTAYFPLMQKIKFLLQQKEKFKASRLITDFASELPKEDKIAFTAWIMDDLKWYAKALYLSNDEKLSNQLWLRFPLPYRNFLPYYSKQYAIPEALIYAVIRQESSFQEEVVSPAGARGLMQLMPTTAKEIARQKGIAYTHHNQLFYSEYNIRLGAAYLSQLAKRYHQHIILIAAAYNAGPRQVAYWLKNNPATAMDIWIETLPWQETRNYLKNIVAFYTVYQYRLNQPSDLKTFLKQ